MNGEVIYEGPSVILFQKLISMGDELKVLISNQDKEMVVISTKYKIDRVDKIKETVRSKNLKEFKKSSGFIDRPGYKFCTSCKRSKELKEFGYRRNSYDGRSRQCKECVNEKARSNRRKQRGEY